MDDHVRRLETLTVYSLKPRYLRTFIDELKEDMPPRRAFTRKVEPTCITLGDGETVEFKDYRNRLPIFKMRDRKASRLKGGLEDGTFEYEHLSADSTPSISVSPRGGRRLGSYSDLAGDEFDLP